MGGHRRATRRAPVQLDRSDEGRGQAWVRGPERNGRAAGGPGRDRSRVSPRREYGGAHMTWLVWRQHRYEILAMLGGAALIAALLIYGADLAVRTRAELGVDSCHVVQGGSGWGHVFELRGGEWRPASEQV